MDFVDSKLKGNNAKNTRIIITSQLNRVVLRIYDKAME